MIPWNIKTWKKKHDVMISMYSEITSDHYQFVINGCVNEELDKHLIDNW